MSITIGFAILTHDAPERLLRLVKTLNVMFDNPPIACHHDFGKCALDEQSFPTNVRFVHPHRVSGWGHISVPLGALDAFRLLRTGRPPDWVFLLSGTDYPVRTAEEITSGLLATSHDACIDNREIPNALPPGFTGWWWIELAYRRYCVSRRPSIRKILSGRLPRHHRDYVLCPRLDRIYRWFQFNRPSRIYAGNFWFFANRKAIDYLCDDQGMRRLIRYFQTRPHSDEALFQTALCSHQELAISSDQRRYEDWTSGGAHPKWLDVTDLPKIAMSGAYFARKFWDGAVLDQVDKSLLRIT